LQSADVSEGSVHPVLVVVVLANRFDGDHLRAKPWPAHADQHGLSSRTNTFLARLADSSRGGGRIAGSGYLSGW
jgi:hypothetical protein